MSAEASRRLSKKTALEGDAAEELSEIELSVVVPVYNEGEVLRELVERIVDTCAGLEISFELIVVDDHSDDDGPAILASMRSDDPVYGPALRVARPPSRSGQLRATLYGMAQARGRRVALLDGDLQDPPEVIAELWKRAHTLGLDVQAIFAAKVGRDDPAWFMVGSALFHFAQRYFSPVQVPEGVGSFVLLEGLVAQRVSRLRLKDANLGAVIVALGHRWSIVPYTKRARRAGRSRVGFWGLIREALGSLALTGALTRGLHTGAGVALIVAVLAWFLGWPILWQLGILGAALGLLMSAKGVRRRVSESLAPALR